jgi:hypothetical protein
MRSPAARAWGPAVSRHFPAKESQSRDLELQNQRWEVSERLTGLTYLP